MGMTRDFIVVGVFQEPAQAHRAIEDLRQAGYSDDEIGYLTRARAIEPGGMIDDSIASGAVEGGFVAGGDPD